VKLVFEPDDIHRTFADTAPSAIRHMINSQVYRMAGEGYSTDRIKTAIEVMQGPLPECFQMDDEMMEQLIASKRKAKHQKQEYRRSRGIGKSLHFALKR
jgi:hypothetical protein